MQADARPVHTTVLIVGGGPSGLTLALDLGLRGIDCHVINAELERAQNPRCNTTSARSMEHFRRLGVAGSVRAAGLPADYPTTVQYRTSMTGYELFRMDFPSSRDVMDGVGKEGWATPEPQHRISQIYLEPVLEEKARSTAGVTFERGCRLLSLRQHEDHVDATVESTGGTRAIRARYLAGCDGAHSTVRQAIGVRYSGVPAIRKFVSTLLRSPEIGEIAARDPAWTYWAYGEHFASLLAIDGHDLWLNHVAFPADHDTDGEDPAALLRETIGKDVGHDVIGTVRWTGRQLVADRYRVGRVFLVGDAAHIWIPVGGFGMNAGIQDAAELAWLIAAVEQGWASPVILDAYELERRPIGEQFAAAIGATARRSLGVEITPAIFEEGPAGDAARTHMREVLSETERGRYDPEGFSFGYHYADSPLITGGNAATIAMVGYPATAQPGYRLPHVWMPDGRPIFDLLGDGYTLLRVASIDIDVTGLTAAAAARQVPLEVLDVGAGQAGPYPAALILVRPDQHVAWMGDELPRTGELLDRITGHGMARDLAKSGA
jgi:2-polyprenyl-6-methoxyphenol hydroxylase-like FAD-dependent oxidoreductase